MGLIELSQELQYIEQDKKMSEWMNNTARRNFLDYLNEKELQVKKEIQRILGIIDWD